MGGFLLIFPIAFPIGLIAGALGGSVYAMVVLAGIPALAGIALITEGVRRRRAA